MSNMVSITKNQLPAHLRKSADEARKVGSELAGGVTSGFPIISYRGKVWRVRKGGEEVSYVDRKGDPIQSIEVVMVRANPLPSKTFFDKAYEEGSNEPPRCWSTDGRKPDIHVQNPISAVCATCPKNQWGSRISESGKKGRACSDVRRMAVVFHSEFQKRGSDAHVFLMRIPPASLNPLKDYADKVLGPAGVEYFAVATRVGFDTQVAHPKLTFRVATDDDDSPVFLSEEEYAAIQKLRDSDDVNRMLTEEPEYAEAGTTGTDEAAAAPQKEDSAPAPAPAAKAKKARPAEEEDVEVEEVKPAPKKRAAKPAVAAEEPEDEPAPRKPSVSPPADDGFKGILDKLLG